MSRRKLTKTRQLFYSFMAPIISFWIRFSWRTSTIEILNEDNISSALNTGKPVIPCYWHQSLLLSSYYLTKLSHKGLSLGFLISPSVDGELASKIARTWKAQIIRGSSTRTGAQAIRNLYLAVKQGISPASTPDGPSGPAFEVKPGVIMLAQATQAPIIPLSLACKKSWSISSWDKMILPKPFSHMILSIGKAYTVDKSNKLETSQQQLTDKLNALFQDASNKLAIKQK